MADFNAIGNPLLAAGVGRLFGVDRPRTSVISSEVMVTTSPWERPEFWALMGGTLAEGMFDVAASGAGFISQAVLWNPPGSGVLLMLDRLRVCNMGANFYGVSWVNTVVGFGSTGGWGVRDTRRATTLGASGSLAARILVANAIGPAFAAARCPILLPAGGMADLAMDWVIPPGWGCAVYTGRPGTLLTNQALVGEFIGRERAAPDTELINL